MKAVGIATMSVYRGGYHRTKGAADPPHASVVENAVVWYQLLTELQKKGVLPGTRVRITISPVRARVKR